MDRDAWLRKHKSLTTTATKNPDPEKRADASAALKRLGQSPSQKATR